MRPSTVVSIIATACLSVASSLVAAAFFLQPPPRTEAAPSASSPVIEAFYTAANEVIASGSTRQLDAILAPGFVDHEPALGVTPDRDGLRSYLLALHAANPVLELRADPILSVSNRAMARVTLTTDTQLSPWDSAISSSGTAWAPVETFRVEHGQIAERWSSNTGLSLIRPLASGAIDFSAPAPRVVAVQRLTLAPGGTFDRYADGPSFLVLEQGSLQLTLDTRDTAPGSFSEPEVLPLTQGQSYSVPSFSQLGLLNVGGGDAQALLVRFDQPRLAPGADPPATPALNEASRQTLAGDLAVDVTSGKWRIEVASVILGGEAQFAVSSASGPGLVSVTSGELGAAIWGHGWQRRGADGMNVQLKASPFELASGDGLTLQTGSQAALENPSSAPATAIVFTLSPLQDGVGA